MPRNDHVDTDCTVYRRRNSRSTSGWYPPEIAGRHYTPHAPRHPSRFNPNNNEPKASGYPPRSTVASPSVDVSLSKMSCWHGTCMNQPCRDVSIRSYPLNRSLQSRTLVKHTGSSAPMGTCHATQLTHLHPDCEYSYAPLPHD